MIHKKSFKNTSIMVSGLLDIGSYRHAPWQKDSNSLIRQPGIYESTKSSWRVDMAFFPFCGCCSTISMMFGKDDCDLKHCRILLILFISFYFSVLSKPQPRIKMKETSTYLKVRQGTWDSKVLIVHMGIDHGDILWRNMCTAEESWRGSHSSCTIHISSYSFASLA